MSNFEKLVAAGAEIVGGDLILKHKVVGQFRNGDLLITEDGLAALAVDDVEFKEVEPARAKGRKKAVETPVDPEGDIEIEA